VLKEILPAFSTFFFRFGKKFDTGCTQNLFSNRKLRKNWFSESHTLLRGIYILAFHLYFPSWVKLDARNLKKKKFFAFRENLPMNGHCLLTGVNKITFRHVMWNIIIYGSKEWLRKVFVTSQSAQNLKFCFA